MNGYLNNLAMRSMDSGNRVEPRLPSMFEAGAVNVGPTQKTDAPQSYEEDVTVESAAAPSQVRQEQTSDPVSTSPPPAASSRVEHSTPHQPVRAQEESLVDAVPPVTPQHDHVDSASVESLTLSVPEETREVVAQPESKSSATNRTADVHDIPSEIHEERVVEAYVPVEHADLALDSQSQTESTTKIELDHPTTVTNVQSPAPTPRRRQTTPLAPRTTAPIKQKTNDREVQTDGPVEIETHVEESANTSPLPIDTSVFESLDPTLSMPQQVTATPWRETRSQPVHWRRRPSPGPTEPEPSINVTIGRIEIRAVPADTRKTNATRRSESPVMPLDEYLRKQRRGAER